MFIKKLVMHNFKWFYAETQVNFNYPTNWDDPSNGINIFVGDNNSWKSTIFEAIDFVFSWVPSGKDENALKHKDHLNENVEVSLEMTGNLREILDPKYHPYIQEEENQQIIKISRSSERRTVIQEKGKEVEMDIKKLGVRNNEQNAYRNITGFDKAFKAYFDIDFIRADTNPSDIARFWSTTICGKLLSRIADWFRQWNAYQEFESHYRRIFNWEEAGSLRSTLQDISQQTADIFNSQFWGECVISFRIDDMDISNYFKNTKIEVNDWTRTFLEEKWSWMQRAVALALLQVYINLQTQDNPRPFYFFIDEPELCMHPLAQIKLSNALRGLAAHQQVFLTTHSPYIFKESWAVFSNVSICKKENNILTIESLAVRAWIFGRYSPTWSEINYFAYNLPTVEFHNELFWFLQQRAILVNPQNKKEAAFDNYLETNISQTWQTVSYKQWIRVSWWQAQPRQQRTLQTYIRNSIHHPENQNNAAYTSLELRQSIEQMLLLI